jgi:hypothetical protein
MGPPALIPIRRKVCCGFCIALKNPSPWLCSNPQPLGAVASTVTTTPPRRLSWVVVLSRIAMQFEAVLAPFMWSCHIFANLPVIYFLFVFKVRRCCHLSSFTVVEFTVSAVNYLIVSIKYPRLATYQVVVRGVTTANETYISRLYGERTCVWRWLRGILEPPPSVISGEVCVCVRSRAAQRTENINLMIL